MPEYERICACVEEIRKLTSFQPEIALVLGSGLGDVADSIEIEAIIDYKQISNFPISTVDSHKGRFIFGKLSGRNVVCMQGRVHYYEGYSMQDVVLPIRVMGMLGAKKLLLTNASGGINDTFKAGDFMMITGHIPTFIPNPLIGENIKELGCRFPGMDQVYDRTMQERIRNAAEMSEVDLKEGKYVQLTGPSFETPEEISFLRMIGADAVGMSTVCEAIAAVHMGVKVAGISCVSNMAAGMSEKPLSANDVNETTDRIHDSFVKFICTTISLL